MANPKTPRLLPHHSASYAIKCRKMEKGAKTISVQYNQFSQFKETKNRKVICKVVILPAVAEQK
jgi:hypothetical protein